MGAPGSPGAGDPYFADLGNGGYDVTHYDLALKVDPATNHLDAVATIDAVASQDLSTFDFDLLGLTVVSVRVNGTDARVDRHDRELVVTPSAAIANRAPFTTVVSYNGFPEPRSSKAIPIGIGWIPTGDGAFVLNEPEGASTWYPVNDHPSDKATYTFHLTVPDGVAAVANGLLQDQRSDGQGHTTFTYAPPAPMASYAVQVAIGDYQVTTEPGPNGITIRNVFATPLAADAPADVSRTADMLTFFGDKFGPYPFDVYGALFVNERTRFALETQTLSVFDSTQANGDPTDDSTMAHELAHQWFGDSVTPASWKDVWLSEGFATYAEWLWVEHTGGPPTATVAQRVRDRLANSGTGRPGDPGVEKLFDFPTVYERGALTLHAVRLAIGDEAFLTMTRTYASRFAGKNATTNDLVDVATEVSGRDLRDVFDQWLYRDEVPTLPAS